jgi:peptidyl-dipeptidase Dcp
MPEEIVMRHRIRNSDIFSSDGYAAWYYSYLWADDQHGCVRGFTEGDGPYDKEVAKRLYESVFSVEILRSRRCLQKF